MNSFAARARHLFFKYAMAAVYAVFGREVTIEGRADKVRIVPLVWKGRIHLLGLNGDETYTAVEFVGGHTLRLVQPPLCHPGPEYPVEPPVSSLKAVHVLVSHLSAPITDGLLDYARKMSDRYDVILAYGGTREEFAKVTFEPKFFLQDDAMRGALNKLNYDELLQSLVNHYAGRPHPDWVFIGDYDTVVLRHNYLDASIATAVAHRKSFVAQDVRDVTASNCTFITPDTLDRRLGWTTPNLDDRNIRIYHTFGAAMMFSWDCLLGMLTKLDRFPKYYYEIGMPSAAVLAGRTLMSMETRGHEWDGIRYRPIYPLAELEQIQAQGIPMVHPVKDLANFLKVSDAFYARAKAASAKAD